MADEREIVSVDSSEEEDSDDAWGHWTAKGRRVLPTQELLAATASSRRVASKRAASAKPSDDFVPGSASDPPAARHRRTAMHGSWQSLDARLCQLQAKVDKINHAKGKPGSASCELFVGKSRSKEYWVDITWARNQGLDRVDGPINPQKAAWSDRFEFQIVEFGQRKWLKVTRVDTNKGWGQQLRVSMTSSSADTRLCQWKQPTSVPTQQSTEDYVRKERAKEQRSAAVAAGNRDSHRLWLDNKYAKRTQKRLAKQSAKEGFA